VWLVDDAEITCIARSTVLAADAFNPFEGDEGFATVSLIGGKPGLEPGKGALLAGVCTDFFGNVPGDVCVAARDARHGFADAAVVGLGGSIELVDVRELVVGSGEVCSVEADI